MKQQDSVKIMQNYFNKIYLVNSEAFSIYHRSLEKDQTLLSQLFTRKNPTIEQHAGLVLENLQNEFASVRAKPNGFAP